MLQFFGKRPAFRMQVLQSNSYLANFGHIHACPLTAGSTASLEVAIFS